MKILVFILFVVCEVFFHSKALETVASASVSVLNQLSKDGHTFIAQNVYLCAQIEQSIDLQVTLWNNLIPTRSFIGEEWSNYVNKFGSYRMSWTNILIGEPQWIAALMQEAVGFVKRKIFNIHQTQMILIPVIGNDSLSLEKQLANGGLSEQFNVAILEKKYITDEEPDVIQPPGADVVLKAGRWTPEGKVVLKEIGMWTPFKGLRLNEEIFQRSLRDFGGRPIVLSAIHKPRVFEMKDKNGRQLKTFQKMKGYVRDVCKLITAYLNLEPHVLPTVGFGARPYPNGSWPGMMGAVTSGAADFAPLDFSITWKRFTAIDFSVYIGEDNVLLISQGPRPLIAPFLLLQVFQPLTWASIIVSIIGCGIAMFLLQRSAEYFGNEDHSLVLSSLATSYKIFVAQSQVTYPRSTSGKLFITFVLAIGIIILSVYRGSIISYLAVPKRTKPIDSAEDLMANLDSVIPIARKGTVYYLFLQQIDRYVPVAEKLRLHDDSFLNTWQFFSLIDDKTYVLIDTVSSGLGRVALFEQISEECKFHVSQNPIKHDWDYMVHPQNSIFRYQIDLILTRMREGGIINKMRSEHYPESCKTPTARLDLRPFSLRQFQSAFYVLFFGIATSLIGFLAEFVQFHVRKPRM